MDLIDLTSFFILCAGTCIITALGAFLITKFGKDCQLTDVPNHRSSHVTPTSRCGGIGIWASIVFVLVFFMQDLLLSMTIGAIGFIGFWVDFKGIYYKTRLVLEFFIAWIFLSFFMTGSLSPVSLFLFIFLSFFIVGTTNIYNFMDGINGIAAITGIIAFAFLAYFCRFIFPDQKLFLLSIVSVIGCLAFLPWNFPKAKVFMGDVASLLLGFTFSIIVVILSDNFLNFVCLASFLFTFYADEIITIFVRLRSGENLIQSHRKHFYQILANEYSISHWKISVCYGFFQILIGVLTLYLRKFGILPVFLMLVVFFIVFIIFNIKVRKNLIQNVR